MNNITLIGMPTSGKTYLGKRLAEKYGKNWVDLDTASLSKTLKNGGTEQDYLKLEEEVLLGASGDNNIFSCSGSSIYSGKGMIHLKHISTIIYLELSYDIIEERLLHQYHKRGVIGSKDLTLPELYRQRTELYQKFADITVNCGTNSTDKQFENICKLIDTL